MKNAIFRRKGTRSLLLTLFLVGLLSGCPSVNTLHPARPVPVDKVEYSGGLGVYTFDDDLGSTTLPLVEAQARWGLGEQYDAGLKVTSFSMIQADLNYALILNEEFALSVDPTIAFLPLGGPLATYLWLPVLADVYTSEKLTLTLSGRVGHLFLSDSGNLDDDDDIGLDGATGLWGIGIGMRHRLSDKLTLMPELHAVFPTEDVGADVLYSFSVGFLF